MSTARPEWRNSREYRYCKILPRRCCYNPNWGMRDTPVDFGKPYGCKSVFWLIEFPDGTWAKAPTIREAKRYIDCWHEARNVGKTADLTYVF